MRTTIDGVGIHVEEEGAGDPVLFIHGWGASSRFWKKNVPDLSRRFRCIRFDLPGYGESEKPRRFRYSIRNYVEIVRKLLDDRGCDRVNVVAHSMGGMVALAFALAHPERVNRLVLVCAPVQGKTALFFKARLVTLPSIRWLAFSITRVKSLRLFLAKSLGIIANLDAGLSEEMARGTYEAIFGSLFSLLKTDLTRRLGEVRMPVLVCHTDRDPVVTGRQSNLLRQGLDPAMARFVFFKGCTHYPMIEDAERFNRVVEEFLTAERAENAEAS